MNKLQMRNKVRENLDSIVAELNTVLSGSGIKAFKPILARLGRGGKIPHWFDQLSKKGTLPNLDGKTIGSIIEMLFVGILEKSTFKNDSVGILGVNPARGVDIPDLDLGIKSPSENYCTSEPFFSAYERLIGNEHDAVILLTDYQTAKKKPPLKVSIIKSAYLSGSEISDKNLGTLAKKHRNWLLKENETWAKKVLRFLAYVNQSDWRARQLLAIMQNLNNEKTLANTIAAATDDFERQNQKRIKDDLEPIPEGELNAIISILDVKPMHLGVITAADDWVAEIHKDFGRLPNDNEWERLKTSPLDGKIGMSFALQWRYNFGLLFRSDGNDSDCTCDD
jgi:hypothetical protein